MATFNTFTDYLPDPIWKVTEAGSLDTVAGTPGPGFASMKLRSVNDGEEVSRTISGRGVHRDTGSHHWEIDINYNPMLRAQFDPVEAFLESRGRMSPFYVVLPQNSAPKDVTFSTFIQTYGIYVSGSHNAGSPYMMIYSNTDIVGNPSVGDLLNIMDENNTNHQKTYKIVRVETPNLRQAATTNILTNQRRIWLNPPLERNVAANQPIRFIYPRIRVTRKGGILEYDLNTDNLYSFSLSLEEIQP